MSPANPAPADHVVCRSSLRRRRAILLAAAASGSMLLGCSTIPNYGPPSAAKVPGPAPKVSELVTHIQCELVEALKDPNPAFDRLRQDYYVVYASLTLDVTDSEGLNPSLSFINPSLTSSINGQLDGTQHRNINQTFTLLLDKPTEAKAARCKPPDSSGRAGLAGELGLKQVLAAGLRLVSADDFVLTLPMSKNEDGKASAPGISTSLIPNFGATIDFTIVYGLGGGPTWTLTHFTGPGSSSVNLLSWSKTTKDTLIITFASAGPRKPEAGVLGANVRPRTASAPRAGVNGSLSRIEEAGFAAQDSATRLILQRLLPAP
jgi:hypothetical protein